MHFWGPFWSPKFFAALYRKKQKYLPPSDLHPLWGGRKPRVTPTFKPISSWASKNVREAIQPLTLMPPCLLGTTQSIALSPSRYKWPQPRPDPWTSPFKIATATATATRRQARHTRNPTPQKLSQSEAKALGPACQLRQERAGVWNAACLSFPSKAE